MKKPLRTDECASWNEPPPDGTVKDTVIGSIVVAVLAALLALGLLVWITDDAQAETRVELMFFDGFEDQPPAGGPIPCAGELNPAGWQPIYKTWTEVFSSPDGSPSFVYPGSPGFLHPVGADIGTGKIVEFVPFQNQYVNLYWDQVQPIPREGYRVSRPAEAMFFGITDCEVFMGGLWRGRLDLRAPHYLAADPLLRPDCRRIENQGGIGWTSGVAQNTCHLTPGKRYYLIIAPYDPATQQHTCSNVPNSAAGCDVGVRLSTGPGL